MHYNATKKYDYIFNATSILIGDEGDNITSEILSIMNEKYEKSQKNKKYNRKKSGLSPGFFLLLIVVLHNHVRK